MDKALIRKVLDKINDLERNYMIGIVWSYEQEEMFINSNESESVDLLILRLYA